jgi:outer membrane protein OmpA-like peptidoglycan-associated protein
MRKSLYAASIVAVAVSIAPACASKKFVRTEVGTVNSKVDTLSQSVEQTQQRTLANEQKIGEVDKRATEAAAANAKLAQTAQTAADGALARANAVGTEAAANTKTQVTAAANTLNTRIGGVEAENRRLIFQVTLSEDQGNFAFGKKELPDAAKARLDEVVARLKSDTSKNIFIEIEGHTDNVGAPQVNQVLGLERAETVKRYLYEQHQIPLHKMNVISYGEDKPLEPNNTKDGRAKNRRVVVKVLS